jgi:hypothetical protein
LGDVYIATGRLGGRTLNIVSGQLSFDAESRSNASMGVRGGYGSKEEYESNERLGEHLVKMLGTE